MFWGSAHRIAQLNHIFPNKCAVLHASSNIFRLVLYDPWFVIQGWTKNCYLHIANFMVQCSRDLKMSFFPHSTSINLDMLCCYCSKNEWSRNGQQMHFWLWLKQGAICVNFLVLLHQFQPACTKCTGGVVLSMFSRYFIFDIKSENIRK